MKNFFNFDKTQNLTAWKYYWPSLWKDVEAYKDVVFNRPGLEKVILVVVAITRLNILIIVLLFTQHRRSLLPLILKLTIKTTYSPVW